MPYIGRPLNAGNLAVQSGTGDGSDTTPIATLDYSVGSSNSIGVYLDGVRQLAGTDFTASGTVLTFTTAPANLVGIDVYFLGLELSIPTPADATVTTAKIVDDAVTLAKMASGTDGNLITYDTSGNPAAVATGSSGQYLKSNGAGAAPTFAAVAAADTSLSNLSSAGENLVAQAWVRFNGTGTVAINDSYNVSSITDNGTGDYTVNFASALANVNYAMATSCLNASAPNTVVEQHGTPTRTTGVIRLYALVGSGTPTDFTGVSSIFFGD